jgi:hypothetical protein
MSGPWWSCLRRLRRFPAYTWFLRRRASPGFRRGPKSLGHTTRRAWLLRGSRFPRRTRYTSCRSWSCPRPFAACPRHKLRVECTKENWWKMQTFRLHTPCIADSRLGFPPPTHSSPHCMSPTPCNWARSFLWQTFPWRTPCRFGHSSRSPLRRPNSQLRMRFAPRTALMRQGLHPTSLWHTLLGWRRRPRNRCLIRTERRLAAKSTWPAPFAACRRRSFRVANTSFGWGPK